MKSTTTVVKLQIDVVMSDEELLCYVACAAEELHERRSKGCNSAKVSPLIMRMAEAIAIPRDRIDKRGRDVLEGGIGTMRATRGNGMSLGFDELYHLLYLLREANKRTWACDAAKSTQVAWDRRIADSEKDLTELVNKLRIRLELLEDFLESLDKRGVA
jgi:hypothetical protein